MLILVINEQTICWIAKNKCTLLRLLCGNRLRKNLPMSLPGYYVSLFFPGSLDGEASVALKGFTVL